MPNPWTSYDREAAELAAQYESLAFETVHRELLGCLPDIPATVLDVGAGSGRDAAWFAARGHPVVALEPAEGMRAEARARHPHPAIRWLPDALPYLAQVGRSGLAFDFILLAAVWMHVAPADRPRAFRKLMGLLAPGGAIAFSLRHGPIPAGRIMHPVSAEELEGLAAAHALAPVLRARTEDSLGRPEVSWTTLVFRLPDDGSGALPRTANPGAE
jgi:SAM-dependent methyltransferase